MAIIAAADGCRGGWVRLDQDLAGGAISWRLCPDARALLLGEPRPTVLALDIPIGLPQQGARACDREARRRLGRPRGASVFPAPLRPVLTAGGYPEACAIRWGIEGRRMSRQAWNIVAKIRDVDAALRDHGGLHGIVREAHPELSFQALNGGEGLAVGKKTAAGRAARIAVLEPIFGAAVGAALADRRELESAADDILDAFALLWTARRIHEGQAEVIPQTPERDACGLVMEIVV